MGGRRIEFGKEAFMRYETLRAPGAHYKEVTLGYAGRSYALEPHGLAARVPQEVVREANAVPNIDLQQRAARLAMDILLRQLEEDCAKLATDASQYAAGHTLTLSGTNKWSDPGSDPIAQVLDARETVRRGVGVYPNVMVIGAQAFRPLQTHPKIVDRIKYTGRDSVTADILAGLFEVPRIVVATAVNVPDPTTGQFVDIWGDFAILAYVGQATGAEEPSFGYTYVLEGHPAVLQGWFDRDTSSWKYPVDFARAPLVVGPGAGFLFIDCA
jgi:hypothetical protein